MCLYAFYHKFLYKFYIGIVYCFLNITAFTFANQMDDLISENSVDVDWRCSFYLNMIAHTSFTVTVAICRYISLVIPSFFPKRECHGAPLDRVVCAFYSLVLHRV